MRTQKSRKLEFFRKCLLNKCFKTLQDHFRKCCFFVLSFVLTLWLCVEVVALCLSEWPLWCDVTGTVLNIVHFAATEDKRDWFVSMLTSVYFVLACFHFVQTVILSWWRLLTTECSWGISNCCVSCWQFHQLVFSHTALRWYQPPRNSGARCRSGGFCFLSCYVQRFGNTFVS